MITDTATELMSTIDMTEEEWREHKIVSDLLREQHNKRQVVIVPDTEPTELTFRRTDEPTKEANWLAFRVAIGMTVMVTCIAFLIVGGR